MRVAAMVSLGLVLSACRSPPAPDERPPPPEAPIADPAEERSVLALPYRYDPPIVGADGSVDFGESDPGYVVTPLDGGIIEVAPSTDPQLLYVTPFARYGVTVTGPGCQTDFAVRARAVGEVVELGEVACMAVGQISDRPGQTMPFLQFDMSDDRRTLALHDGAQLFLVDADGYTVVADAGLGGPPRWAGGHVFFGSEGGTGVYDVGSGTVTSIPVPYSRFLDASDAGGTALFAGEPDGLSVFSWQGDVEQVWSRPGTVVGDAILSPTGRRVAYLDGYERTIVADIDDPTYGLTYDQSSLPGVVPRVVFDLDGVGALSIEGGTIRGPDGVIGTPLGSALSLAPGHGKLMLAFFRGLQVFESATGTVRDVDIPLSGDIDRAMGVGDKLAIRIDDTTHLIDVDTEAIVATFDGWWRAWSLGNGQTLMISNWDLSNATYPLCSSSNPCPAVVVDDAGVQVWDGDVALGVPFGERAGPWYQSAGPRDGDGCNPVDLLGEDGEVVPVEGGLCHVQAMPDRFFGIPCLPHAVSDGPEQGIYCAY